MCQCEGGSAWIRVRDAVPAALVGCPHPWARRFQGLRLSVQSRDGGVVGFGGSRCGLRAGLEVCVMGGRRRFPAAQKAQTALPRWPEKYDGSTEPWNGLLGRDPEGHRAPTPTTGPPSGYSGLPGAPSDLLRARGSAEARGAALLTVVALRLLTQRRLPALTGASAAPLSSSHLLTPQGRPGCSVPTAAPRADRRGLQSPLPGAGP